MKPVYLLTALTLSLFACMPVVAEDSALIQRIAELEKRVTVLEQELRESGAKDRWKDPVMWQRLKREMASQDVQKILGKPARIEQQIFTTWYYHSSSKLHSYVWLDEGKVLGWELPDL